MKNLKLLMLSIMGCVAMVSCDNDDDNNNNQNDDIVGTYRMTSWNAPMAGDFNDDGVSSTNFMTESNCFNNSTMTVNANGTYTMSYNTMGMNGTSWGCGTTQNSSGTWTRNGNTFTTTSSSSGTSTSSDFTFNGTNQTMTHYMSNAQYPSFNATTGNAEFGTGNVNYVFTMD